MKKRSLFAAVAMLIVSAILLTSSTYAWFAASHEAEVKKVTATVDGKDEGNVQVSVSNSGGWTTSLDAPDFLGTGKTSKKLNPVDLTIATIGSPKKADFDTTNYKVGDASTNDMLIYTWYVRAVNRGSNDQIVIPVAFEGGDCLYGVIKVDGNYVTTTVNNEVVTAIWGTGGNDSYVSLGSVTKAVEDGTTAGIIDTNDEKTGTLGASVGANMAQTGNNITIDISNETNVTYHTIEVTVWAAGQDSDCVGTKQVNNAGFTFGDASTEGSGIRLNNTNA